MGHHVRGIGQSSLDVVTSQARAGVKQIGLGCALAELAEDQLDRDTRPSDHRLPKRYCRVYLDAIRRHSEAPSWVAIIVAFDGPASRTQGLIATLENYARMLAASGRESLHRIKG
jgi:hypothetical protein